MRFFPTHVDYKISSNVPVIRIVGRDENKKRVMKHVSGFYPYGYTKLGEEKGIHDPRIVRWEKSPPSLFGEETIRFVTRLPSDVSGPDENFHYVKDNFKTLYETDVLFATRCKIDGNINGIIETPSKTFINRKDIIQSLNTSKIPLRSQYIDIEAIGGSIKDVIAGKSTIPCFTIFDNYLNEYILYTTYDITPENEEKILNSIKEFWTSSFLSLKEKLSLETNPEKLKILQKQVNYLSSNLDRILSLKLSIRQFSTPQSMFSSYLDFNAENRPDIQSGWNSLKFDAPAIVNTLTTLGINPNRLSDMGKSYVSKNSGECVIDGLVLLDLMDRYVGMQLSIPSHSSLDYISKKELGVGKIKFDTLNFSQSDIPKFLAYNVVDVMLCVELDNLLHITDFYVELAVLTNSNLSDSTRAQYIDNLILSHCNGKKVLPTRKSIESERMSGAIVYPPKPGLHRNVIILDFAGMYPSIMKSIHISPENKSKDGTITAANGVKFLSTSVGLIPEILFELQHKRDYFKSLKKEAAKAKNLSLENEYELKQYSLKVTSNAFYGVMGYKKFRLADRDVGDAVTSTGRALSLAIKAFVEGFGYIVIYGDTDSLFIEIPGTVTYSELISIGESLVKKINEYLPKLMKEKFNTDTCYTSIEMDAPFKTLLMLPKKTKSKDEDEISAKKRYAGFKWESENSFYFKAKGVELIKGNTSESTKLIQEYLLKSILNNLPDNEIFSYLKDFHTKFFSNKLSSEYYGRPGSLRKELSEYSSDIPIKKACEFSNENLSKEYKKNSSFILYYISHGETEVIALDDQEPVPPSYQIDLYSSWEKLVESPTETILMTRSINWSDIINETKDLKINEDDLLVSSSPIIFSQNTSPAIPPSPKELPTQDYSIDDLLL